MKLLAHYKSIADVFEYPDSGYPMRVQNIIDILNGNYPGAVAELERFLELLPAGDVRAMQELFTRSFDVQAITTLDIGYVMFGDDYKRAELLTNLNREHREVNNDCRRELADHLPNVLRLLAKLKQGELTEELVEEMIVPALSMMISEFDPERIEQKNEAYKNHYKTLIEVPSKSIEVNTLYQCALRALYDVLKQDFSFTEKPIPKATSDFLQSITRENEIEEKADPCYQDNCSTGER